MKPNVYKINTHVWLYPGMAGWHFATIPADIAADIDSVFGDLRRGWGSLRVRATIGITTWDTSIFPDKETKGYMLPLKASVRKKENISADDKISLTLEIKM